MKLLNPTDDQLNAAFADRVAGWTVKPLMSDPLGLFISPDGKHWQAAGLPFTRSADAVLPWLEKWRDRPYLYRLMQIDATCNGWVVKTAQPDKERSGEWHWSAEDESLARACVIALLRAHGVEVEFTK